MARPSSVVDETWNRPEPLIAREDPVRRGIARRRAEGHHRELRSPDDLDPVDGREPIRRELGQVQHPIQRLAEGGHAMEVEREPDREPTGRAGQLGPQLEVVRQVVRGGDIAQVRTGARMGRPQRLAIPDDEGADPVRQEQPLVRIEGHGVRSLDAAEAGLAASGHREEAAVRRIDMEPGPGVGGDVGDRARADPPRPCPCCRPPRRRGTGEGPSARSAAIAAVSEPRSIRKSRSAPTTRILDSATPARRAAFTTE